MPALDLGKCNNAIHIRLSSVRKICGRGLKLNVNLGSVLCRKLVRRISYITMETIVETGSGCSTYRITSHLAFNLISVIFLRILTQLFLNVRRQRNNKGANPLSFLTLPGSLPLLYGAKFSEKTLKQHLLR
jgi:hypothetical protein